MADEIIHLHPPEAPKSPAEQLEASRQHWQARLESCVRGAALALEHLEEIRFITTDEPA